MVHYLAEYIIESGMTRQAFWKAGESIAEHHLAGETPIAHSTLSLLHSQMPWEPWFKRKPRGEGSVFHPKWHSTQTEETNIRRNLEAKGTKKTTSHVPHLWPSVLTQLNHQRDDILWTFMVGIFESAHLEVKEQRTSTSCWLMCETN